LPSGGAILLTCGFHAHRYRLFGTAIIIDGIPAERKMNRTADLDAALGFVIGRIEQEAARSGESLSDEQRFLLNNLPKDSVSSQPYGGDPEIPAQPSPRDAAYERVCAVAKLAHHNDLRLNPASALDWEFAAAVTKLNRHPMSWLLQWAGVKVHRPWWDRWLLIAVALLFIFSVTTVALLMGSEPWTPFQWAGVGAVYIGVLVLLYFASRRIEEWQLIQNIERCRRGPSFTIVT
jgi:hypothetical protein